AGLVLMAEVARHSRTPKKNRLSFLLQEADVAKRDQIRRMHERVLEEYGSIGIFINKAAIGLFQTIGESDEQDIFALLSTNLPVPIYTSRKSSGLSGESG